MSYKIPHANLPKAIGLLVWSLACLMIYGWLSRQSGSRVDSWHLAAGIFGVWAAALLIAVGIAYFGFRNALSIYESRVKDHLDSIPIAILLCRIDDAWLFVRSQRSVFTEKGERLISDDPSLSRRFFSLLFPVFGNKAMLHLFDAESFPQLLLRKDELLSQEACDSLFHSACLSGILGEEAVATVEIQTLKGQKKHVFIRWIEMSAAPSANVRSIISLVDRTKEVLAQKALVESERRLRGLYRASPVGFAFVKDRHFSFVNERLESMLGYSAGELEGRPTRDIYFDDDLYMTVLMDGYPDVSDPSPSMLDVCFKRKDGSSCDVLLSVAALELGLPEAGFVVACLDVTEMRRREMELQEVQLQLVQAQKAEAVGVLVSGAAHDFSNILTAIMLQLAMLRESGVVDPELMTIMEELSVDAHRGVGLTRQLLLLGRGDLMSWSHIDLAEVVRAMASLLVHCIGRDYVLDLDIEEAPQPVRGNRSMIEQVVLNLVINARDAMPERGTVCIKVCRVATLPPSLRDGTRGNADGYVWLSVTDSGCGMSMEVQKRIFDPFYTTKSNGRGNGLGLAVVKTIVDQHGGHIEVASAPGKGSTLSIFFPFNGTVTAGTSPPSVPPSGLGLTGTERILLLEEDHRVGVLISLLLRQYGYEVSMADGAYSAGITEAMVSAVPSLLILDTNKLSQTDLARVVSQAQQLHASIPIIMIMGLEEKMPAVFERDPNIHLLSKPFDASMLLGLVKRCLG